MSTLIDVDVRYDLAESTSSALTVGDLATPAELAAVPLGYGTSTGAAGLRALIAADSGVDPGQVLVTAGAVEAMALLAQVTCGPGDRVLVATPCFPPARAVPESLGAQVDTVPLTFEAGYRPPVDAMAAALTPRTRLVSIASPQNPSGVRFTGEELTGLLDAVAARAPDAVVLIDETYRAAGYGDATAPASAATRPRVVTCSSLSKAHGTPGLRIGWLTSTDPDLYERLREAKFRTAIACPNLDELLATRVLQRSAEILAPRARRLRAALDELLAWADGQPVEVVAPDGGALCCLRRPDGDAAAFHARLAELDTRIAPGPWFGDEERVFRLGFGHLPPAGLTAALERLADALRQL